MAASELRRPGPFTSALEPLHDPGHLLPLRIFALIHRWVLAGKLPELAHHCRSMGGWAPPDGAWPLFRDAVVERAAELPAALAAPYRHHELAGVGAVACAIEAVGAETGRPLRLLEAGAGAGLLLCADRYRDAPWFPATFEIGPPRARQVEVAERVGCDPHPIDLWTCDGILGLRSRVWADLASCHRALIDAINPIRWASAPIQRADPGEWLERRLAERETGLATVVIHSTALRSEPPEARARIEEAVARGATRATASAPLALVRLDLATSIPCQPRSLMTTRLRAWPGGAERLLATSDVNGRRVQWLG